jgi:hypothetical protein
MVVESSLQMEIKGLKKLSSVKLVVAIETFIENR